MNLDIKKAICSPFSDTRWYIKCAVPIFFFLISGLQFPLYKISHFNLFIINYTILLPAWFIIAGFVIQFAHNEIHNITPLLPEWKEHLKKFLKIGIVFWGVLLIYLIPILLISFLYINATGKIFSMINLTDFNIKIVLMLFPIAMIFPFISFLATVYSDNFRFKDSFNITKIFKLIFLTKEEIVIYLLLITVSVIFDMIFRFYFKNTFVLILLPFKNFIFNLIFINAMSQIYKVALYKTNPITKGEN